MSAKRLYSPIKSRLQAAGYSTRHFTAAFLADFIADYTAAAALADAGDFTAERYAATRSSDFYKLNGGSYCEFLAIFDDICEEVRSA
nr:MAG TPA: hypothetical protein [Caudoviricetes sp.]